jgi:hypothetical protein
MIKHWIIRVVVPGIKEQIIVNEVGKIQRFKDEPECVRWMNRSKADLVDGNYYIPTKVYVKSD